MRHLSKTWPEVSAVVSRKISSDDFKGIVWETFIEIIDEQN